MARGTSNTGAGYLSGEALPPDAINDMLSLVNSADDDLMYELTGLNPPAAASATNVRTAQLPFNSGASVKGDSALNVKVQPMRVMRSSTSNSYPRQLLSALISTETTKALPTAPTAGNWGIELLQAQITYVDPTDVTKGTQVTLNWAPAPAYVAFASAANFATLPAQVDGSWKVPLKYVKNVAGATTVSQEDIIDIEPDSTYAGNLRTRLAEKVSGVSFGRVYSTNQNPKNLVSGGSSAFNANALTSTKTPAAMWRNDVDFVVRSALIPEEVTGGTTGADVDVTLDTSRDWRKANFKCAWNIRTTGAGNGYFGEESTNIGAAASRSHPVDTSALYLTVGQTHETYAGGGTFYAAGIVTVGTTVSLSGAAAPDWASAGDYFMLIADTATGALKFRRKVTGSSAGGPIYLWIEAEFPNAR